MRTPIIFPYLQSRSNTVSGWPKSSSIPLSVSNLDRTRPRNGPSSHFLLLSLSSRLDYHRDWLENFIPKAYVLQLDQTTLSLAHKLLFYLQTFLEIAQNCPRFHFSNAFYLPSQSGKIESKLLCPEIPFQRHLFYFANSKLPTNYS